MLHSEIGTKLPQIRKLAGEYADAATKANIDDYPAVRVNRPPNKGRPMRYPHKAKLPLVTAKALVKQMFVAPEDSASSHPQAQLGFQDAKWWRLARYDSALVTNAGGSKVAWYRRDPKKARAALAAAIGGNAEIVRRWDELREKYRAAARDITSFEAWEKTFAAHPAPKREDSAK